MAVVSYVSVSLSSPPELHVCVHTCLIRLTSRWSGLQFVGDFVGADAPRMRVDVPRTRVRPWGSSRRTEVPEMPPGVAGQALAACDAGRGVLACRLGPKVSDRPTRVPRHPRAAETQMCLGRRDGARRRSRGRSVERSRERRCSPPFPKREESWRVRR